MFCVEPLRNLCDVYTEDRRCMSQTVALRGDDITFGCYSVGCYEFYTGVHFTGSLWYIITCHSHWRVMVIDIVLMAIIDITKTPV